MQSIQDQPRVARAIRHVLHASAQRMNFRLDNVLGRWIREGVSPADASVDCVRRLAVLEERLSHEQGDPLQDIEHARLHSALAWYLAASHGLTQHGDEFYRLESVCTHAGMAVALCGVSQNALAERPRDSVMAAVVHTAELTSNSLISAARALIGSTKH